jgi:hypothetical protein
MLDSAVPQRSCEYFGSPTSALINLLIATPVTGSRRCGVQSPGHLGTHLSAHYEMRKQPACSIQAHIHRGVESRRSWEEASERLVRPATVGRWMSWVAWHQGSRHNKSEPQWCTVFSSLPCSSPQHKVGAASSHVEPSVGVSHRTPTLSAKGIVPCSASLTVAVAEPATAVRPCRASSRQCKLPLPRITRGGAGCGASTAPVLTDTAAAQTGSQEMLAP